MMSDPTEPAPNAAEMTVRTGPDAPYLRIALPVPLGKVFTYSSPSGGTTGSLLPAEQPARGSRVVVEFGRGKRLGVVVGTTTELPEGVTEAKLKRVLHVVDQTPALPEELLDFLLELAKYYLAPVGEVLALALPTLERALAGEVEAHLGKKVRAVGRLVQVVRALESAPPDQADRSEPSSRRSKPSPRAEALLELVRREGPLPLTRLALEFPNARALSKRLLERGLVEIIEAPLERDPYLPSGIPRDTPPALNTHQAAAVSAMTSALESTRHSGFLLDGVTASGKTEVYLHVAEKALALDRGVILLVPEIALTPQLVTRFAARLGDRIAVLHSGLTETARADSWRRLRKGELRVVIGARSALFSPVRDLGLIVVDEEHDGSFKQDEGVRYNARDMALLRAHRAGAVAVLGSATPSLASEYATRNRKLTRLRLPGRAHASALLPEVEVVDLKRFGPGPSGDPLLSLPLHRALEQNLADGGQSILFLNRRGFAPSLICADCGAILECPNCAVALTVHQSGRPRVMCHYCDFEREVPGACGACRSPQLLEEGTGTERVEALLGASFPEARIARLDRDVARGDKSAAIIERVRRREVDILVGTQMVTKGHDLPAVTLVGVLNADAALSLPDFRAAERTFHILVQVAGRAGRADRAGRVLIQTRNPEHPAIVAARSHDVGAFTKHELAQREELSYPPFSHLALVRVDGPVESDVQRQAAALGRVAAGVAEVEVLGPARAPLGRLRGRYRHQLLLRSSSRAPLRKALLTVARSGKSRSVRVSIDVDPQSML